MSEDVRKSLEQVASTLVEKYGSDISHEMLQEYLLHRILEKLECIDAKLAPNTEGKSGREFLLDVTCEQCGERYVGRAEDIRGWYEFVEQEPRRIYAFCSEVHMEQWKADRGVQ